MLDLAAAVLVLSMAGIATTLATSQFGRGERRVLWVAFGLHALCALAQVWVTTEYYRGGDMLLYHRTGGNIARWIEINPGDAWPEALRLLCRQDSRFPFTVIGIGSTTGTMSALAAILQTFLGPSLYVSCLAMAFASFLGKVAIFTHFREAHPADHRAQLAVAAAVPSLVYWTSGLLKEALAVAGLGLVTLGLHRLGTRRIASGAGMALAGVPLLLVSKPYVLFAFVLAGGVWFYWSRAVSRTGGETVEIRPLALLVAAGTATVSIVVLGQLFPTYSIESFADQAAHLQTVGAQLDAGSNYALADPGTRGMAGQLLFAPLALLTALFRPLFFEARNPPMAISAVETTMLVMFIARSAFQKGIARLWRDTRRSPALMLALTFVLTFAVAVGLSSTNLGTLSRYRVPMLPFLVELVVCWHFRSSIHREPARSPVSRSIRPRRRALPATT